MMNTFYLFILLTFSSCASYVNQIHRQIDNESGQRRRVQQNQQIAMGQDRRPIQNPVTLGATPTANTSSNYYPENQRNYNSRGVRRYRAEDLKDNDSDGSLWSGQNAESFLFVTNNMKKKGDIVIIDVYSKLKEKIQEELARNYPEAPKKAAKGKDGAAAEEPPPAAENAQDNPEKVYDKISTSVIEQVNQDYLLVRGRKEIMYKNFKRYFEIQAVISQKDINQNDIVPSKKVLEPKINVLRY